MKKILFTLFAVCIMFAASAQFKGGIKAGLNFANLSGDVSGNSSLTTFHVGLYGQKALSDALTLQPELLYYGAGSSFDGGSDYKLSYLAIPIMFKYGLGEKFNIQAGPQIGFLMSTDPSDLKDSLKGTDFGLNVGAGVGFGKLSVDARYNIGLANVVDVSGVDVKNNVFLISVGYQLFGGE